MTGVLHSYLFAWLFVLGISLGSMANLMVLALTGGRWADPVRPAWIAATRVLPVIALLFIPLAFGARAAWSWADAPGRWLNVPFFIARSVAYLVLWSLLSWSFLRGRHERRWAAGGLIAYGVTVSLAAVDWIASLTPGWSSSGFGLVVATSQMLSAAAFGIAVAGLGGPSSRGEPTRRSFHDLGNLLLMYVLTWMYLAYTQFLVVWSENIPREIHWYVPRMQTGWSALGMAIVALHFALPLLILLSRTAKRSPRLLGSLGALLLAAHGAYVYWLVMPSVRMESVFVAWSDPLALLLVCALGVLAWKRARRRIGAEVAYG
jgi:hypothetical protein